MDFKIGDKVRVLDEDVRGRVSRVNPKRIVVYTDFGFEASYAPDELVADHALRLDPIALPSRAVLAEKEAPLPDKRGLKKKPKSRDGAALEVDLHIEQIVDSPHGLSRAEMLDLQKSKAFEELEEAMERGVQRLVFIHGVGEGVLKRALCDILERYANLIYYDASYAHYGAGATEVQIVKPYPER